MSSNNWVDKDELWNRRRDCKWESFSWLTIRALLSSVNDVIAKSAPRLVNELRDRWVASQRKVGRDAPWNDDLVIRLPGVRSFLLLGDPGEQDFSQYAVVPVLATQDDADFLLVLSDVIYPSGDANDYVDGFYIPYGDLDLPIYAIPGNHDWYDGLNGFMWNFCGSEPLPPDTYDAATYSFGERLARRIWKKASAPQRDTLGGYRAERVDPDKWAPLQPGPYYAIETDELLIVCVDSGITGDIDRAQAEWLVRVSESTTKPKVMLVGRPLVDKKIHRPGRFPEVPGVPQVDDTRGAEFSSVDAVARHERFGYVAAIGGDTHNYQRYDVSLPGEDGERRPFHYIVSGGGGAYMSATHIIDGKDELQFDEDQPSAKQEIRLEGFDCYPSRVASLQYFAELVVPRLWRLVIRFGLAVLGLVLATLAGLVLDLDDEIMEGVLIGTVAVLAIGTLVAFLRPGRRSRATQPSDARRAVSSLGAFLVGLAAGLAAWWLSPNEFGGHALVFGGILVVAGLIAQVLRKTGLWRTKWVSVTLLIGQPVAALVALGVFVLDQSDPVKVFAMAAVVLLLPAPFLMLVDRVRGLYPGRYKLVLLAGGVVLVAVAVFLLDDAWGRAAAAAAVVAFLGLVAVVFAHLHFLNAFSLFYRPDMRSGTLDVTQAGLVLKWRAADDAERPPVARTRRIGNMVYPGSANPHGPLHRFISEIFDKDDPPLYKNFLRVDVTPRGLTITCFHATGEERGPDDVRHEDPIEIRFTPDQGDVAVAPSS